MTEATPGQFTLRGQRMGALPLLSFFLTRLGLAERLQSYLPRGDACLRLAPAAVIGVVVRSIVVARRPLLRARRVGGDVRPGAARAGARRRGHAQR